MKNRLNDLEEEKQEHISKIKELENCVQNLESTNTTQMNEIEDLKSTNDQVNTIKLCFRLCSFFLDPNFSKYFYTNLFYRYKIAKNAKRQKAKRNQLNA